MFTLVAQDGATSNRGIAIFTVTITDVNDNYPRFTKEEYQFKVSEDATTSTIVGRVTAIDLDTGFNSIIEYGLQPSPYSKFPPRNVAPSLVVEAFTNIWCGGGVARTSRISIFLQFQLSYNLEKIYNNA